MIAFRKVYGLSTEQWEAMLALAEIHRKDPLHPYLKVEDETSVGPLKGRQLSDFLVCLTQAGIVRYQGGTCAVQDSIHNEIRRIRSDRCRHSVAFWISVVTLVAAIVAAVAGVWAVVG